jgi:hypothetical protein
LQRDCEVIVKWLQSDCKAIAMWLQSDCKVIAKRLQSDCKAIAKWLQSDCKPIVKRLYKIAKRLESNCKAIAKRLHSDSSQLRCDSKAKQEHVAKQLSFNKACACKGGVRYVVQDCTKRLHEARYKKHTNLSLQKEREKSKTARM